MLSSLILPNRSKSFLISRIKICKQFCTISENKVLENEKSLSYIKEHQITLRGVKTQNEYQPILTFNHPFFLSQLKTVLRKEKFESPTPIQAISWPVLLDKKDVISVAKTGSGKTLAFLLPAFNFLLSEIASANDTTRSKYARESPYVLVLAPTRELAQQTANEALKYTSLGIKTCTVFGGAPRVSQVSMLRKGVNVVVATPGRCNDLADDGALDLSKIKYLVLDEADRMLDMGFEPQIRGIIDQIPKESRQTLMFTATWPKEVQSLAADFLINPVQINIGDQNTLNANKDITQHIMIMKEFEKFEKLMDLMKTIASESDSKRNIAKTIIFVGRKYSCDDLVIELRREGYTSETLHGDKSQALRDEAMAAFRAGRVRILVATDIAARGLDVKDIQHVINFDFPDKGVEDYVHRIGRTARGGSKGTAYTFLTAKNILNNEAMSGLVGVLKRCEQEIPQGLSNFSSNSSDNSSNTRYRKTGSSSNSSGGKYGDPKKNFNDNNNYGGNNNSPRRRSNDNFDDFDFGTQRSSPRRSSDNSSFSRSSSNRRSASSDFFD